MALSKREQEVARLVAEGLSNRAIGQRLFISERTVEAHVQHVLDKLGFDRRTQIAAWVANDLQTRSDSRLPAPMTSFVGRQGEVREIRELLERRRLVTLTGPGGVGKTRLALAAANMSGRYSQVAWADLSTVDVAGRIPIEIAHAVTDGASGEESDLLSRLGRAVSLLVVDNCEHLAEDVARMVTLLLRRTRVVILATSRTPLEVEGEVVFVVPPLSEAEALELFRERAQPGVVEVEVEKLCQQVECLPLAVELAAARTRVMSVSALTASLATQLDVLAGVSHAMPDRLRSLEGSIAWSYEQLSPHEQAVFRALGAFEGGFELSAATEIAAAPLPAVLDLVDKSLVSRTSGDRYRLLFPIRQYARARLEELGERATADDLHDRWVTELVRPVRDAVLERDWEASQLLWRERDEIWATLNRARRLDTARFATVAPAFALVLAPHGLRSEALRLAQEALPHAPEGGRDYAYTRLVAAVNLNRHGQFDTAERLLQEVLKSPEFAADAALAARTLMGLARIATERGDHHGALTLLEKAKSRAHEGARPTTLALLLNAEAMAHWFLGSFEEGERAARTALQAETDRDGILSFTNVMDTLALNLEGQGRNLEALEVMRQGARFLLGTDLAGQAVSYLALMSRTLLANGDEVGAATLMGAAVGGAGSADYVVHSQSAAQVLELRQPEAFAEGMAMDWKLALQLALKEE